MRKVRRMDSFDKKISDLYNADQSSNDLPEGFGWDDMNKGIYEKMEEPKKKRRFVWMWFSFGVTLILLATLLFFFNSETQNIASTSSNAEDSKTEKTPIHLDKTTIDNNLELTENIQETPSETKESYAISIDQHTDKTSKENKKKIRPAQFSSSNSPETNIDSNANLFTTKRIVVSKEMTQKDLTPSNETPTSILPNVKAKTAYQTTVPNDSEIVTDRLAFISIQKMLIPTKRRLAPPIRLVSSHAKPPKDNSNDEDKIDSKNKKKILGLSTIQLYGGTLLTSGEYSQNLLRNKHSKWLPGYYLGIESTVLKYKKWKINLGYEHKFAVQLLDFQNITDITDIVVENAVVGISTNSINGTNREIRETILTPANRTRNYLNYNTFRAHAFRMTFVRTFDLSKKLSFNAGIGGSFNFLNQANGRTVDIDKDTLNYEPSNSIYRKNNFGIDGGFSISYKIGKFSLNGNVWMERSLNFSLEADDQIHPVFYKIGLGVSRRF